MSVRLCLLGDAASIHLQRWATAMLARGFEVSVVSGRAAEIEGVVVTVLPVAGNDLQWFARLPALRRTVRQLAPDIVHAHYITSYGLWGALSGRRPLVMSAWGSDILVTPRRNAVLRWLTTAILRRAALITADSRDVLQAMAEMRPRATMHEVFWGADTTRFCPDPVKRADEFGVASLRAWEPNYRVDVLLRAFAGLVQARPDSLATLHLFGGGSMAGQLQALSEQLGIAPRLRWHGWMAPAEMARQLAACDVSVSVPQSDATSVSLLESMSCGLPVVVSDLPANRQWVDPEQGGHIVPVDDVAALTQALLAVHDDGPAQRLAQGAFNRARIERLGSTDSQMNKMAALYIELLDAPGPGQGHA
nr:glycosyltransferase [uncultured Roseateles sp.]